MVNWGMKSMGGAKDGDVVSGIPFKDRKDDFSWLRVCGEQQAQNSDMLCDLYNSSTVVCNEGV